MSLVAPHAIDDANPRSSSGIPRDDAFLRNSGFGDDSRIWCGWKGGGEEGIISSGEKSLIAGKASCWA